MLMQVVLNATGAAGEVAGDAFVNSVTSLMGSATALIIAVSGIVVALIAARSNGRTKTKQEEQVVGAAEAIQLVMQKLAENEARLNSVGKATLALATTDEQRKKLDENVVPVVNTSRERIEVISAQIPAIKEILGVKTVADVNAKELPRESEDTLKTVNALVTKAKLGE